MGSGLKLSASIFEWNVLKVSRTHIYEMIGCSFFLSVVGLVISVFKIYWRCENYKCKHFFFLYKSVFGQISTKFRHNSTNFRQIVVVDQTS